jgi:Fe-S cluster assembly ATP-binding protein
MLEITDLHVTVADREVLRGIELTIRSGETMVLFGPNGSGKTTLLMAIMGMPAYKVTRGRILFNGRDITEAPVHERARLGIGMSFQRPPTIHGLSTRQLVTLCGRGKEVGAEELAGRINMVPFLDRDINAGFSGGEIKRSELLQLMAQQPQLLLFDEPESEVDLENIQLIGAAVRSLLEADVGEYDRQSLREARAGHTVSGLIITHTGYILNYINVDRGQVLYDGRLCCDDHPRRILEHIQAHGYEECIRCLACQTPCCPATRQQEE